MSKSDLVYNHVSSKIKYIRSISDTGTGRGIMANLRHGIGKKVGELPELWGIIFDEMHEELIGNTYAEWSVYTALTLYALHQQSNEEFIHEEGISLGSAAYCLVKSEDDINRVLNRMNLVATAVSPEDLAYHLRGVIQLLKRESIHLDYAKLAKQLYLFYNQEKASAIKLSWGRDFYGKKYELSKKENNNE